MLTLKNAGGSGPTYSKLTFAHDVFDSDPEYPLLEVNCETKHNGINDTFLNITQVENLISQLSAWVKINKPKKHVKESLISGKI